MKNIAIYPGTFDPITNGHLDIIERAAKLFDQVIIAVAASAKKSPHLSLEKRVELVQLVSKKFKNVKVASFNGLLVAFAKKNKARVIIRSMRAVTDFEYELQLASMNRSMAPAIETIFLAPAEQYAFVSATIVREIMSMQGEISKFVPKIVAEKLKQWH